MTGCCAFGCSNKSEKGYKMYRFPADPQRRKIWENKIHFDESQFENGRADGKKKLKWQAVPTIFCHRSVLKPRRPLKRLPCTPNAVSATKKSCVSFDHTYCINPADKTTSTSSSGV
ncbi:THAP domain-containing protein 2-like [Strongylocentrotus purpuratus]|uniref:THAP-type domain-containing protein n=1 Tax=Strongylocentrotus purpuratus TaxID=7668 RepID=A0A7M7NHW6_STRPU|nr:THAP domain-containing protein 2-like [Strongylocentrotus purpuratus]